MKLKKKSLSDCRLYWVAGPGDTELPLLDVLEASVRGGLDVFQLRDKQLPDDQLHALAKEIGNFLSSTECLFIVNDRPELAVYPGVDGVHVGQDDCKPVTVRSILRDDQAIGLSTHSLEQAAAANQMGVDYIGYGPIFKTPTKPDYIPVGMQEIQSVVNAVDVPVFCIGGIGAGNLDNLLECGAARVAVVREIARASNPYQVTKNIKRKLGRIK